MGLPRSLIVSNMSPATKRRKVEHVSSSDEDDDASFASFGDDDAAEGGDVQMNGDSGGDEEQEEEEEQEAVEVNFGAENDDEDEDDDDDDDDEDEDDDEDHTEAAPKPASATPKPTAVMKEDASRKEKSRTSSSKAQVGATAYANGTFKSNVFKLQVDELLGQIRPRQGQREASAGEALRKLKHTIEQIPARGPHLVSDAERDLIKQKVAIPFPDPRPPKDAKYKFSYAKPVNVNVIGSFMLKTSTRSRDVVEVDMVVTMPSSIFEEKDYMNYRYFYKRAYYLACLAAGLQKSHRAEFNITFALFRNDPFKPVLVISPLDHSLPASQWKINIIPCVRNNQFAAGKLGLDKNCVRNADDAGEDGGAATSFYNSSLRSDMLTTAYLELVHSASKSCEGFKDACLLGSTWLRQRGFASSTDAGGFGNFEWSVLIALCLQGGGSNGRSLLSEGYSSYQLFKATLQLLAMKDFVKQPLIVGSDTGIAKLAGVPVLWDTERAHNLLYKVGEWSYRTLRHEARSTLAALGDQLHDGFDATFILRVHEPLYRNDYAVQMSSSLLSARGSRADPRGQLHIAKLYTVMKQGLGDRVNHLSIIASPSSAWDLGSAQPRNDSTGLVTIGLMVNSENFRRTVDHGPSAEQKAEGAAFRKFWGDKAELRRFKDGSILESLVWASPSECGQSVLEQVIRYLLGHHFGAVTTDDLKLSGDGFGKLIRGGTDISPFSQINSKYKRFEQDIRGLSQLPLSIRQIMPSNAQLCYSSLRTPPNGAGRPSPADVTIQFEGSGRWPDDLAAIQRTKIAFLLMIDKLLRDSVQSITCRVGLENDGQDILNQGFLDVTYSNEATFRLRIYHDRELHLLKTQMKNKTTDPRSRELATTGLAKYKRDYEKGPSQTQALTRLCTRFPALSGSIRLTKKWFASHLLTNHIPDQLIELFVIRAFVQPAPWTTPSSIQTGFLRTLFFLSRWDWRAEPLIVDLSASGGELKQSNMNTIRANFEAWRQLDPAMNRVALFAASNLDPEGTTWTDYGKPAKVVVGRMIGLARAACGEVTANSLNLEPASLFGSPLEDFDFVLHLTSSASSSLSSARRKMMMMQKKKKDGGVGSDEKYKNLSEELSSLNDDTDPSLIGYDPVLDFLSDLEHIYSSAILFFYGGGAGEGGGGSTTAGGIHPNVIAGLWNPEVTRKRSWKVNLACSTLPIVASSEVGEGDEVQTSVNKSAVLAEIARLGGDLVERIVEK